MGSGDGRDESRPEEVKCVAETEDENFRQAINSAQRTTEIVKRSATFRSSADADFNLLLLPFRPGYYANWRQLFCAQSGVNSR